MATTNQKFVEALVGNMDLLNLLVPEHSRTSCSDANPCNSFHTADNGGYRCTRCALLEIVREGAYVLPPDVELNVDIMYSIKPKCNGMCAKCCQCK